MGCDASEVVPDAAVLQATSILISFLTLPLALLFLQPPAQYPAVEKEPTAVRDIASALKCAAIVNCKLMLQIKLPTTHFTTYDLHFRLDGE